MPTIDHAARAAELLDDARDALDPGPTRTDVIAAAAVHAQLALVGVLERLVGDPGWVER